MAVERGNLARLARSNVVQVRFTRRTPNRFPRKRRMLLTLDVMLLNSALGKKVLLFKKPTHPPAYDAASKNLLFVWDIIMCGWRAVPCDLVDVISVIPTRKASMSPESTRKAQEEFWDYFNNTIMKMSPRDKADFLDH